MKWTDETERMFDELVAGLPTEAQEQVRTLANDMVKAIGEPVTEFEISNAIAYVTRPITKRVGYDVWGNYARVDNSDDEEWQIVRNYDGALMGTFDHEPSPSEIDHAVENFYEESAMDLPADSEVLGEPAWTREAVEHLIDVITNDQNLFANQANIQEFLNKCEENTHVNGEELVEASAVIFVANRLTNR